ncbi:MAG: molecular chaperone SurA, partial [Anaerolineae bacterium]|nr:molecular chaperone SurA [Anaerolineae bacterium]
LSRNRTIYRRLCQSLARASLMFALPLVAVANVQPLDAIVAIVDNDVVLASELQQQMAQVRKGLQRADRPVPPEEELRRQVLDQLVVQNLQLQMAERAGVRISDSQLN